MPKGGVNNIRVKRLVPLELDLEQLKRPSGGHILDAVCSLVGEPLTGLNLDEKKIK